MAYPAPWLYGVYGFGQSFVDSFMKMRTHMLAQQKEAREAAQKERALDIEAKATERYSEFAKNYERAAWTDLLKANAGNPEALNKIMKQPGFQKLFADFGPGDIVQQVDPMQQTAAIRQQLEAQGYSPQQASAVALTMLVGGKSLPKELFGFGDAGGGGKGGGATGGMTFTKMGPDGKPLVYDFKLNDYRPMTIEDAAKLQKKNDFWNVPEPKTPPAGDYNYDQEQRFGDLRNKIASEGLTEENKAALAEFNISAGADKNLYALPATGPAAAPGLVDRAVSAVTGRQPLPGAPTTTLRKSRTPPEGVVPKTSGAASHVAPTQPKALPPGYKASEWQTVE